MNKPLIFSLPVFAVLVVFSSLTILDFENNPNDTSSLLAVSPLVLDGASSSEQTGVRDNVEIIVKDQYGNITFKETTHNKVVTLGENCAAKMIFGYGGGDVVGNTVCVGELNTGFNYIALGESSTAVADTDTTLVDVADETGLSTPIRGALTWTNSTTGSFHTVLISSQFTNTGSSETIREVGLFDGTNPASDTMYARAVISDAVVGNGDDITINWTFETGAAAVP